MWIIVGSGEGGEGWGRVFLGHPPPPKTLLLLLFIIINDSGDSIIIEG
jgi:hypothetical protein